MSIVKLTGEDVFKDSNLDAHSLIDSVTAAGIDYEIRGMEKPSDHCPIWAEFDLEIVAD